MGVVFVNVGMTLYGFIAPEGIYFEHADDPGHKDWLNRWMRLQDWVFQQQFFRRNLQLGETGQDNLRYVRRPVRSQLDGQHRRRSGLTKPTAVQESGSIRTPSNSTRPGSA